MKVRVLWCLHWLSSTIGWQVMNATACKPLQWLSRFFNGKFPKSRRNPALHCTTTVASHLMIRCIVYVNWSILLWYIMGATQCNELTAKGDKYFPIAHPFPRPWLIASHGWRAWASREKASCSLMRSLVSVSLMRNLIGNRIEALLANLLFVIHFR